MFFSFHGEGPFILCDDSNDVIRQNSEASVKMIESFSALSVYFNRTSLLFSVRLRNTMLVIDGVSHFCLGGHLPVDHDL